MSFFRIVVISLKQHRFSSLLAAASIGMGVALLVAVYSFKEQTHRAFTQVGLGVDALLAPKGSPLQIALNALYHLENMPGKIKWTYFKAVSQHPIVAQAIPFVVGHSYAGFRVNAIDAEFFTKFEYLPGKTFSFRKEDRGMGRPFEALDEAVAGWVAAKTLGLKIGDHFNPVCGVHAADTVHKNDRITFVGILAPTGTPHDRAIYIPLKAFYGLEGHPAETRSMAESDKYREISGAYLKIKRIRGGAIHPGIQGLQFEINQSDQNQIVIPNEVLPKLFKIVGWINFVLTAIAVLLTVLSTMFLFVSLLSSLRERRRDLALLRSMGATRRIVMGLVISESVLIGIAGGLIGLLAGHALVGVGAYFIGAETGVVFTALYIPFADWLVLPGVILLGFLAGLAPGIQAYRLGVLSNLSPIS